MNLPPFILSAPDWDEFARSLGEPPAPNEALKALAVNVRESRQEIDMLPRCADAIDMNSAAERDWDLGVKDGSSWRGGD